MNTLGARIRGLLTVVLCLTGLADVLFIYVQEGKGTLGEFCEAVGGSFGANCEIVLTSRYSEIAGISLSLWGIFYYLSLVWLSVWSRVEADRGGGRAARMLLALMSGTGCCVSLYLTYLQASVIKAWCPFCLGSAALTTGILILSVYEVVRGRRAVPSAEPASTASRAAIGGLAVLTVLLASGLAVSVLYRAPDQAMQTFEKMLRYLPRRMTPPGGLAYGSDTAPVVVQAFLDFTCEHCRHFESEVFPRIKSGFIDTGRVKWISKLLPHSDQGAAMFFSMGAVCGRAVPDSAAVEQAFFMYPIPSDKTGYDAVADALQKGGVSLAAVDAIITCMQTRPVDVHQQVVLEVQQAFSYGLKGPPAFVIDGLAFQGSMDFRTMSDLLEIVLKQRGP